MCSGSYCAIEISGYSDIEQVCISYRNSGWKPGSNSDYQSEVSDSKWISKFDLPPEVGEFDIQIVTPSPQSINIKSACEAIVSKATKGQIGAVLDYDVEQSHTRNSEGEIMYLISVVALFNIILWDGEFVDDFGDWHQNPVDAMPGEFEKEDSTVDESDTVSCPVDICNRNIDPDTVYDHCLEEHGFWDESWGHFTEEVER